jgi:hypothetical protein
MPKAKRTKINWYKLFKKINSERQKQRPESSPDCLKPEASCSVPKSAENKDSGMFTVFDSKAEQTKEPVVITIDSDENEDTVSSMGNSNSLVCDSAVQHNQSNWYCSVANWTGRSTCYSDVQSTNSNSLVCDSAVQRNPNNWYCSVANWTRGSTRYADVQSSYPSEVVSPNMVEVIKSVQSGDGALESATGSSRQTGRSLSKCIRYPPEACCKAALFLIISDDLE